jgi:lipid-binding SYLF domain-containing protein
MKYITSILMLAFTLAFGVQAHAATRDEQRTEVQKMQTNVLAKLYKFHPGAEKRIKDGVGYAVFSTADVAVGFFSGAYGHGIAHNNTSGSDTYMQMGSAGVGLGLGVKDFRTVFVFSDAKAFRDFTSTGLDLSGHADLAAKQGTNGAAVGGEEDILPGVRVYQFTDTGLMAQVMLRGTKYWGDNDLNEHDHDGNEVPVTSNH